MTTSLFYSSSSLKSMYLRNFLCKSGVLGFQARAACKYKGSTLKASFLQCKGNWKYTFSCIHLRCPVTVLCYEDLPMGYYRWFLSAEHCFSCVCLGGFGLCTFGQKIAGSYPLVSRVICRLDPQTPNVNTMIPPLEASLGCVIYSIDNQIMSILTLLFFHQTAAPVK